MSNSVLRRCAAVVTAGAAVVAVGLLAPSTAGADVSSTVLDYRAQGWTYSEVAYGDGDGFQAADFDDSAWPVGQAGFGSDSGVCGFEGSPYVNTAWTGVDDELIRHHFSVPAGTTSLHIAGTIDNNAAIYVNGTQVATAEDGNCNVNGINVDVPAGLLTTDNVIAIRATNLGGPAFVDVQLTATSSAVRPTVTSISPTSGPTAGGTAVTIRGTGFLSADRVLFAQSSADFTIVSDTEIDAISPAHGKGTFHVRVGAGRQDGAKSPGLSAKSKQDRFRYTG